MTLTIIHLQDDQFAIYKDGKLAGAYSGPVSPQELLGITVGNFVADCKCYGVCLRVGETFPELLDAAFFARLF